MIRFAFKIAAKTGSPWSALIAEASGSIYSHVECWLDGPQTNARCFSSREPYGAAFEQIDLTSDMWDVLALVCTPEQEEAVNAYCLGANGKYYDAVGLLGYALKNANIHDHRTLFCSEACAEMALICAKVLPRDAWQISPGDLYALVKADFKLS